ncbi:flagellar hook-basal body complex protein [Devosia sp.]|uniref:flagellar hook-basal body complex protein n=1 Tax=Devosia sp. TaxID=1871048 RepID=UPI001AC130C9|nr:flagellar hook-basal body complex protein [Devosia sp.]MBN9332808.1 flagellar hook-basal body complex protein [Devosia sp.]
MGIFGALQSAVSGLKAQSHAMENISGNIANSQTIGYKRIDTSFVDMIPDAPVKQQIAGAVSSYSRSMNTLRGDIQNADTETYMALNGNGFFVVENGDGSGGTFYTRRGDFDIDRNGYLVNGAGYRLTGLGMENGVVTGSVAQAVKIDNSFLPAKRSTTINYQLNLPQSPKTASYVSTTPGSELLKPWGYSGDVMGTPIAPKISGASPQPTVIPAYGYGNIVDPNALASTLSIPDGSQLTLDIGGTTHTFTFGPVAPQVPTASPVTVTSLLADIQGRLQLATGGNERVGIKDGRVFVQNATGDTGTLTFGGTAAPLFGLSTVQAAILPAAYTSANMPADLMGTGGIHNKTLEVTVGGVTRKYLLDAVGNLTAGSGVLKVDATGSMKEMLDVIQADLRANGGAGASGATVNWDAVNGLVVDFPGNYRSNVSIAGTAAAALNVVGSQNAATGTLSTVSAANSELFVKESISGGGITVYSQTGEPVNVQMRWAKVSDEAGIATWSLFYASDSAPGSANAWTKLADYTFDQGILSGIAGGSGVTVNGTERLAISNLSINGRSFGSITIDHGLKGMTQFADNSGMATTTQLKQDGYGAGEFISVGISDQGQVIASYTNGETRAVAQIITASFSNPNALKRGDGGTYTATTESGGAIINQSGAGIVGSSTEASNTDISEEFTKLIVTQQAYSANTKIVTAADEMLKQALNMIR